MNSILSRLNAIFAFSLTVMACLAFGCFLTTCMNTHDAEVKLGIGRVLVRKAADLTLGRVVNDLGYVTLDIESDLEHVFNWNVKQIFLYLTAEYETSNNKLNQVVLWDKIVQRGESAKLNYKSINTKYYFWDDGLGLRGNDNVTLTLSWNVIPNTGRLDIAQGKNEFRFSFPKEYLPSRMSS